MPFIDAVTGLPVDGTSVTTPVLVDRHERPFTPPTPMEIERPPMTEQQRPDVRRVDLFSDRVKGGKSYLLVDNTVSGGVKLEMSVMTCNHCGCVVVPHPQRVRPRGHCKRCNHYICDKPGCRLDCNPMDEMLDLALSTSNPGDTDGFLARTPDGMITFDERIRDRRRIH